MGVGISGAIVMVSNPGDGSLSGGSLGEAMVEGDAMPGSIGKPMVSRSRL